MKTILNGMLIAAGLLLSACSSAPKSAREGKVTFIALQYGPSQTMLASQYSEKPNNAYTNVYPESDPYLEWYGDWVIVRYTIKEDGVEKRRHLTVPSSSIYSFNWDWKKDEKRE
jgi:hypothetical protein